MAEEKFVWMGVDELDLKFRIGERNAFQSTGFLGEADRYRARDPD
ncbi:MAG: hypothetical protein P1U85_07960 [Verrucomicrobiales bacterium]|nr:hypothetical protein [Verrucomicrobiales bacterium]